MKSSTFTERSKSSPLCLFRAHSSNTFVFQIQIPGHRGVEVYESSTNQLGSTVAERPAYGGVVPGSIPGLAFSFSSSRGLRILAHSQRTDRFRVAAGASLYTTFLPFILHQANTLQDDRKTRSVALPIEPPLDLFPCLNDVLRCCPWSLLVSSLTDQFTLYLPSWTLCGSWVSPYHPPYDSTTRKPREGTPCPVLHRATKAVSLANDIGHDAVDRPSVHTRLIVAGTTIFHCSAYYLCVDVRLRWDWTRLVDLAVARASPALLNLACAN